MRVSAPRAQVDPGAVRVARRMGRFLLGAALLAGVTCGIHGRCPAQSPEPPLEDMMQRDVPSKPITLGDMVNRGLFAIAREVFSRESVSELHEENLGAPKRGVQVDLFTPGDAGITIRYRW